MILSPPAGTDLVAPLPNGSMFQVARVSHRGRVVVCKRLLPRVREEPVARAAMAREAGAIAKARHASLPDLVQVGSDAHGPFLLETFVEGVSMRELVEAWRGRGRDVPPSLVAHLAEAATNALAEVHELPIEWSHGDLGPEHLRMDATGAVGFVDFGAARFAGMSPGLAMDDRGTLPFAPPEVARGEVAPSQGSDVYALAATLLLVAGNGEPLLPPMDEAATLLLVGEHGLPPELADRARGLGPAARDALRRAVAFDPKERLSSARALAVALSR